MENAFLPPVLDPVPRDAALQVLERPFVRQHDLESSQATAALRRRRRTLARPGVEPDVMVVAAGGDEEGARVSADRDVEAERAGVEGLGGRQGADVQVDVADAGP